jgi:cyclic beta-1,2-glucan synthetase
VILNEHPVEYLDEVQAMLTALVQEPRWAGWNDRPGGMFLLRSDGMPEADRHLLSAVARVVVRGDLGELGPQLDRPAPWLHVERDIASSAELTPIEPASVDVPPVVMENDLGGFAPDGREYAIVLDKDRETPLPWSNVLANAEFGTMVSASGSTFTWAENSRENRLTPLANDPIGDPQAEAIYLRDEDSGAVWGATPGPLPREIDIGRWVIRHSAGVTRYQHAVAGLEQELTVFVPPHDPVKVALLTLTNTSTKARRLSVFGYVEWCLGPPRVGERRFVVTDVDAANGVLLARNPYNTDFSGRVAFWRATQEPRSYTCDRSEFVGHNRTLSRPAALFRDRLAARSGAGLDPCAAMQINVIVEPGEYRQVAFGTRTGRRPGSRPRRPILIDRAGQPRSVGRGALLGRYTRCYPGEHTRRLVRPDCEPMVAVSGPELPHLGAVRPIPVRGCVRLSRSAAGCACALVHEAGSLSGSSPACRVATVRRRRRPTLVASTVRPRYADAMLRRFTLAAVCRGYLCRSDRGRIDSR